MPILTVETSYRMTFYRQRSFDSASIDEACRHACEDEDWSPEKGDIDTAGETYVSGIWLGPFPYQGESVPVPSQFEENIRRRADHFYDMLALLKETAQRAALSTTDRDDWRARAQAAVTKAEAIISGHPDPDDPAFDLHAPDASRS